MVPLTPMAGARFKASLQVVVRSVNLSQFVGHVCPLPAIALIQWQG